MTKDNYNLDEDSRLDGLLFASICGVLCITTIAFGAVDTWALGLLSIVSAFLISIWGYISLKSGRALFNKNHLQLPIIGLILIGIIQLLPLRVVSEDILGISGTHSLSFAPHSTRFAIIQLTVYLVFFAVSLTVLNNEGRVRKLVYLIIVFGALMGFLGILQRMASTDDLIYGLRQTFQATPFGPFVNSHHFAGLMEMTIAFPLALLFGKATKSDKRGLLIVAALVMGMAILLTNSRGGLLSFFGVIGFIVAANILDKKPAHGKRPSAEGGSNYRRNFALVGGGLATIILIVGMVLYLGNGSTLDRMMTMNESSQDLSTGRTHFWNVGFQIFADHPIIGSGLDSFGTVFPAYDTWNGTFRIEQAHNDYLQILSDAGILGFLCAGAFIFLLFRQGLRVIAMTDDRFLRNAAIGALAGCSGILIHSFFDFPLRTSANSFFFLILAVIATTYVEKSTSKRKRKNTQDESK